MMIFVVHARYRMNVEPFLDAYAAVGAVGVCGWLHRRLRISGLCARPFPEATTVLFCVFFFRRFRTGPEQSAQSNGPQQHRRSCLAASIRNDGLLQNLVVRPVKGKGQHYRTVGGEHRCRT